MKKIVLTITALAFVFSGIAQEKMVASALYELNGKNYAEAKTDIDKAQANPETKDKPKTLYAKAQVYLALREVDAYKASEPWKEAMQALIKLAEVKPEYEKDYVNGNLVYGAGMYYNAGIKLYNEKKNDDAVELLKNVVKIQELGGGKRFEKFPRGKLIDTMSANAQLTIARCAYFGQKYEDAISMYNKLNKNPIAKSVENYNILLDAYDRYNTNNANKLSAEELAAIQAAVAEYPNDANIKAFELNYYIKNNKLNELVKKMEDAVAKEPNSADLQLSLAMTYQGLANPKDGKKPADAPQLLTKSENAYLAAYKLAPENTSVNFNLGILYFNQAVEFNEQMGLITGSTAADNAKYDDLKNKRDAMFQKATPYLEKSYSILSPKANMTTDDKATYHSTLVALKQIYGVQNKTEKMKEMSEKLKAMN